MLGYVRDDRRRVEVALSIERLSARQDTRAGLDALPDLRVHVFEDLGRGERPHVGVLVHRVADLEGGHALHEAALELVGDLLVDDDPLGVDARLPVVERARSDGSADGRLQIRRGHHDERVAPAELEYARLDVLPRLGADLPARTLAAGQRRRPHPRVVYDRLHLARADQERLEGALREAGAVDDVLDGQRALRHVGGVLQEDDVAGHERRGDVPEDLPEREVPRHDGEYGTQRLVADEGPGALDLRLLVGEKTLGVLGVVAAAAGALLRLGGSRRERLAHLARHQAAELLGLFLQDLRRPQHHLRPLGKGGLFVLAEGVDGVLDLLVYLLLTQRLEGPDLLARRRVDRRYRHDGPPYKRLCPVEINIHFSCTLPLLCLISVRKLLIHAIFSHKGKLPVVGR